MRSKSFFCFQMKIIAAIALQPSFCFEHFLSFGLVFYFSQINDLPKRKPSHLVRSHALCEVVVVTLMDLQLSFQQKISDPR